MKKFTNEQGIEVYEFEDDNLATEFAAAMSKISAQQYVVDRMIDGMSQSFLGDLQSGLLKNLDDNGKDVESLVNVLKIAAKYLADLMTENMEAISATWAIAHKNGLPDDERDWTFNRASKQFFENPDSDSAEY